jgi:flagellar FliL protein
MTEATETPAAPAGRSKKKFIIIAIAAILVIGGSAGAAFALLGGKADPEAATAVKEGESAPPREAIYVNLEPDFVVNFQDSKGKTKFLKAGVNVVTRDPETSEALEKHMPVVRNNLLLLFSRQIYENLVPPEGKERLRADALAEIQTVVGKELPAAEIEDVLFTSFVMQ